VKVPLFRQFRNGKRTAPSNPYYPSDRVMMVQQVDHVTVPDERKKYLMHLLAPRKLPQNQ